MGSTDLVKDGNRPEIVYSIIPNEDGKSYRTEFSFVFPKYRTADIPRYINDK